MKKNYTLPVALLILFFSGALLTVSCNKPQLADRSEDIVEEEEVLVVSEPVLSEPSLPPFPLDATIRNQSGKELVGTVLAKSGNEIAFYRKADGNKFVIPLANLHPDDQMHYGALSDQDVEMIDSIKNAKLQVVNQTRIKRPTERRRRLSLDYENGASYTEAAKRAEEEGTNLLLIFLAHTEVSEECTS